MAMERKSDIMTSIDLAACEWRLFGWRPYFWRLGRSMELGMKLYPMSAPFPRSFRVAQTALLAEGMVKDWNRGLDSQGCEWVENRHWEFSTLLPAGLVPSGLPVTLRGTASITQAGSWSMERSPRPFPARLSGIDLTSRLACRWSRARAFPRF